MVRALNHHASWAFEEVLFQVDGGSENWNKVSFCLGIILMEKYAGLTLTAFNRMRVGHTKNDLDQKFSIPYTHVQGRKALGEKGTTVLGHSEWVTTFEEAFEASENEHNERASKGVKRRKSRVRKGKTDAELEAERKLYTRVQEPMTYAPQRHNFDLISMLGPLIDRNFAGYGPVRDEVLKSQGFPSIHSIEFYREGGEIHWHYKSHMKDADWVDCGNVYDTILTRVHEDGTLAGKTAREVIVGLGDGTLEPGLEEIKWFATPEDCEKCEKEHLPECKCGSGYEKFKKELAARLQSCKEAGIRQSYVNEAQADWDAHFAQWDDHEGFLAQGQPKWGFPPAAVPAQSAEEKALAQADQDENQEALARVRQACHHGTIMK